MTFIYRNNYQVQASYADVIIGKKTSLIEFVPLQFFLHWMQIKYIKNENKDFIYQHLVFEKGLRFFLNGNVNDVLNFNQVLSNAVVKLC